MQKTNSICLLACIALLGFTSLACARQAKAIQTAPKNKGGNTEGSAEGIEDRAPSLVPIELASESPAAPKPAGHSLEGLGQYDYPATPVEFVRTVSDTNGYKSELISFAMAAQSETTPFTEYALLSTPKTKMPPQGYPLIILIHGYIPPAHYSTINSYKGVFHGYASSEFAVVKPDLRGHGNSKAGKNFDITLRVLFYTEDIYQLISSLAPQKNIDAERIFLMGHSNGGNISLWLLASRSDLFKGAVLWAPVSVSTAESNFFYRGSGRLTYGLEVLSNPNTEVQSLLAAQRKKVTQSLAKLGVNGEEAIAFGSRLDKIQTPVIIRHADTDESVPYSWSLELMKHYRESGNTTPFTLITYPGDNHNLAKNQRRVIAADLAYFRSLLTP